MKTRVVVLVLLTLAGCGRSDQPEKSTAAKDSSTAATAPAAMEAVAAVQQSAGEPVARVGFFMGARPVLGRPAKLRLDLSATNAVSLLLVAEADGLSFDPDSARGTLVVTGGGAVTNHELRFTAQREGLLEILVRLRSVEPDSLETVYAIPVLIGPAATGG